ncbi:unnamed protein product [Prorocentrum cordatum]|uniref:cellulase n=1 Tax=Prorocentrum cordatum TaxID=2364126 RepID=A0ABN9W0U9_9DINO|nr:unnamed protein product [Polarella glacialis]
MQLTRAALCLPGVAVAQMAGMTKEEQGPPIVIAECTLKGGCEAQQRALTLDANWRWVHGQTCQGTGPAAQCYTSGNCFTDGVWDDTMCPDPESCAENCALEGVTLDDYDSTYGVAAIPGGVELGFVRGPNVGSRLYVLEKPDKYKLFKLLNREFTFDVDVSTLPCGLNGALYFSEMDEDGGMKHAGNKAGAKYGTGYCDAQCPHDVKFMEGKSNTLEWNTSAALGKYGLCCAEVDIWEANSMATAFTMHPCTIDGTYLCKGKECGDNAKNERYDGVCDKDGCDFNSYRNGLQDFFGPGDDFTVDTTQPMTVVTQFVTDDGTDDGDLVEIRRLYVQGGKVIKNSNAGILGSDGGDSITDAYCSAQKDKFGDPDDFHKKGALKQTGEALRRGMTLVLSLWDDYQCQMLWLDSDAGKGGHSTPGVARGPCDKTTGVPADVRAKYPDASVAYFNIMYGEIGSTYTAGEGAKPDQSVATGFPKAVVGGVAAVSDGAVAQPQQQALQQPSQPSQPQPSQPQQPLPQQAVQAAAAPAAAGAGASAGGCADVFQQCGGDGWAGASCCQAGCTCAQQGGPSYSQCLPPVGAYLCSGPAQPAGLVQRSSLREAHAQRARDGPALWVAAVAPAVLLAAAAAVWVRARRAGRAWSSAQLRTEEVNLMASAEHVQLDTSGLCACRAALALPGGPMLLMSPPALKAPFEPPAPARALLCALLPARGMGARPLADGALLAVAAAALLSARGLSAASAVGGGLPLWDCDESWSGFREAIAEWAWRGHPEGMPVDRWPEAGVAPTLSGWASDIVLRGWPIMEVLLDEWTRLAHGGEATSAVRPWVDPEAPEESSPCLLGFVSALAASEDPAVVLRAVQMLGAGGALDLLPSSGWRVRSAWMRQRASHLILAQLGAPSRALFRAPTPQTSPLRGGSGRPRLARPRPRGGSGRWRCSGTTSPSRWSPWPPCRPRGRTPASASRRAGSTTPAAWRPSSAAPRLSWTWRATGSPP